MDESEALEQLKKLLRPKLSPRDEHELEVYKKRIAGLARARSLKTNGSSQTGEGKKKKNAK